MTRSAKCVFAPGNVVIHLEAGHRRIVRVMFFKMSIYARSGRLGQSAKGECDGALSMRVDVLAVHFHLSAVMNHAFNHRGDLGGRWRLELRVDAQRVSLNVPVDHDSPAAVARVPLSGEILVPSPEMLRVRGAGSGAGSPRSCCRPAPERRTQRFPRSSRRTSRRSNGRIFCSRGEYRWPRTVAGTPYSVI